MVAIPKRDVIIELGPSAPIDALRVLQTTDGRTVAELISSGSGGPSLRVAREDLPSVLAALIEDRTKIYAVTLGKAAVRSREGIKALRDGDLADLLEAERIRNARIHGGRLLQPKPETMELVRAIFANALDTGRSSATDSAPLRFPPDPGADEAFVEQWKHLVSEPALREVRQIWRQYRLPFGPE